MVAFPGIKKTHGRDFNYFTKTAVNWTQFGAPDGYTLADGYGPDQVITFSTYGLIFNTEGSGGTNIVEYSFNGTTVHGELVPSTNRATLTFLNRVESLIWFRLKSGAAGPITVSVEAWSIR
jgi:hypothetical protein